MIQLKGINKTYFNGAPLHVLKGIDLDIEKGEILSITSRLSNGRRYYIFPHYIHG